MQQASLPEEINATVVLQWFDGATIELRDQMIRPPEQDMKCQRSLGPKFRKVKISIVAEIPQVSNILTPNAGVCGDTPV